MNIFQILFTLWSIRYIHTAVLSYDPLNFAEQTKHPGFVDKTMLIETIFHQLNCNYHLITYPSKFGKSSNLKMIQSFVELKANKFGHVKKKWNTTSYKLFTNKSLGLKIAQHRHLIRKHLAEYPVIYITFRNIIRPTFEETIHELSNRIRGCYEKYHWLYEVLKNDSLQEKSDEWGYLLRGQIEFWDRTYINKCRAVDLQNSLFALSKILCYYLDKKIFVLIDDYDAPLIEATALSENITYHVFLIQDYVNGIIQKLFKPSCLDQYVEYGFVTGITSYLVSSSFTKIENIRYYRFLDNHIFTPFFGFSSQEIHDQNRPNNAAALHITSGYQVGNSSMRIYNPDFYFKYLNESKQNPKSMKLPLNTIDKDFVSSLIRNPRIRDGLQELFKSRLIRFKLLTHITVQDFRKLIKATDGTGDEYDFDVFYTLLYEIGYFSYTNEEGVFSVPEEVSDIFTD